jgi:hypothetical protein
MDPREPFLKGAIKLFALSVGKYKTGSWGSISLSLWRESGGGGER